MFDDPASVAWHQAQPDSQPCRLHSGIAVICREVGALIGGYLSGGLPPRRAAALRLHLDACDACWQGWDRLRWNAAAGTALYAELVEFQGSRFAPYLDSSRMLGRQWDLAQPRSGDQVRRFYRDTEAYLYNQVIWHASGNRPRYVEAALPLLSARREATIIDYGCGIGEDTLAFHRSGFSVLACDLPSPPTTFLTWRAPRHDYPHPVHDPDALPTMSGPVILWIIDALDHLADINSCLSPLLRTADLVICENLTVDRSHGRQGFHVRRSIRQVDEAFGANGLRREPSASMPAILSVWQRPVKRARSPGGLVV